MHESSYGSAPARHVTEQRPDTLPFSEQRPTPERHVHLGATAIGESEVIADQAASSQSEVKPETSAGEPSTSTAPEATLEQRPGDILMEGMRTHLCLNKRVVACTAKLPSGTSGAIDFLLRVNQDHESLSGAGPLDGRDVRRLFLNIYAYTKTEKPAELARLLDPATLRRVYEIYATDLTRFREAKIRQAATIALLHSSSLIDRIDEKYGAQELFNRFVVRHVFSSAPRTPEKALEKLMAAAHHFTTETEPQLRAEYGIEGAWNISLIHSILLGPLDAEVAARRILENMRTLQQARPDIHPERVAAWAETQVFPRRSPAQAASVEAEIQNPPIALNTQMKEKLEEGRTQLDRIRSVRRRPRVVRGRYNSVEQSDSMADFMEHVVRNREAAFGVLNDLPFETMRLESAIFAYNNSLDADDNHLRVSTDTDTLYAIFLAYALDVEKLRQKGYAPGATTVAWYHDVEVYDRYIEAYAGKEGITPEDIVDTIRSRPLDIERQLEALVIRKRMGL